MSTLDVITAARCPQCGGKAAAGNTQTTPALNTARLACDDGHAWEMRWMPEVGA